MELQQIVDRIRAIRSEMSAIETRITDLSLTLTELEQLDGEWDTLDAELALYEGMLDVWVEPEFEEPPAPAPEEQEEEEKEEEIDYANPPEWLVKKWDEERDSWTNWNAYESEAFDLADEV